MRVLVLLLLAGAAAADAATAGIDKATAARMVPIGERAFKAGAEATARCIFERAVDLDPDQPVARARLGYRRTGKEWTPPASPPAGADKDARLAAGFRREMRDEEVKRAEAFLRAGLKEHYTGILDHLPRHEGIHKALGHAWIGGRYARPELSVAVKRFDEQHARWRGFAAPAAFEKAPPAAIPGVGRRPAYGVGGVLLSGSLPDEELRILAKTLPAPHAFLHDLFGPDAETWNSPLLVFASKEDHRRCVEALFPPGKERDDQLRRAITLTKELTVFTAFDGEDASDVHAHAVGIYSAQRWSVPRAGDKYDWQAYAWFGEGMGFFASLSTLGTGLCPFHSTAESSAKIPPTVPPPDRKDRASLLPWLQGQMLDGTTEPLRGVCGRMINSLDLLLSLEAWSFLEFLAAYDPDGFRRLPAELRAEEEGAYPDRADRALRRCFGKGLPELEPLWRAFVLENM